MYRTLAQLRDSINQLIDEQGEDAPVAAFVFTNEDVFTMDEDNNPDPVDRVLAEKVLSSIEETDYIYTTVFDCIENELIGYSALNK
jgi:hypothetical protein